MNDNLVTLTQFENPAEANIVKSILDANEIFAVLKDENISSVNPYYTMAIGFIKLQVKESDVEKAVEILKENNFDFQIKGESENIAAPPCPRCRSRKVYPKPMSVFYMIFSVLLLFIPIIVRIKEWVCYDCRYTWKESFSFGRLFVSLLIALFILGVILTIIK